eukprot:1159699-Pelagomonas_calceolata.AAC.8
MAPSTPAWCKEGGQDLSHGMASHQVGGLLIVVASSCSSMLDNTFLTGWMEHIASSSLVFTGLHWWPDMRAREQGSFKSAAACIYNFAGLKFCQFLRIPPPAIGSMQIGNMQKLKPRANKQSWHLA